MRHRGEGQPAIVAMGVNLRGCETPNCVEPQPRAQDPRSTTLMPTPKGTAEQRTTGTKGGEPGLPERRLEQK